MQTRLRGRKGTVGEDAERLKRRLPLLEYLRQQNWIGRPVGRGEYVGLCPLHQESRPSFYVNARKDVFYCHGCGQGGDLFRFLQLSERMSFRESLACLDHAVPRDAASAAVLEQATVFYQQQLERYPEALGYLRQRGTSFLGGSVRGFVVAIMVANKVPKGAKTTPFGNPNQAEMSCFVSGLRVAVKTAKLLCVNDDALAAQLLKASMATFTLSNGVIHLRAALAGIAQDLGMGWRISI